jgi:Sel1 repeat
MKGPAIFVILLVLGIAMFLFFRLRRQTQSASPPLQADGLDDAVRLLSSGKIDQGMRALRSMAEKGNVKAQLFLGHAYANENPIVKPVDYSEAMKWFKRASSQGSGEGSAAVAELYEQGLGVTKSSEEAKAWWELAAKQGYDQQELDVRCLTRTPDAGSLTCEPFSDGSGCPADAEMESLRTAGVTGRLKPTGGGGGRFRLGPKARALIVLDHRIISEQRLKQPRHTNIIYVQHETGWVLLPTNAPLLDRPIVLSPQPDAPQFTMAGVQDVDGSISAGGCAAWK